MGGSGGSGDCGQMIDGTGRWCIIGGVCLEDGERVSDGGECLACIDHYLGSGRVLGGWRGPCKETPCSLLVASLLSAELVQTS